MNKVRRYSEAAFVSILVTACGGGDNSSNMTPINSGSEKIDETSISSPILEESESQKSDSVISEPNIPTVPEVAKSDEAVSETPVPPSDENVDVTVNPSPEPTTPEAPKSDEAVSETPVPPSDENVDVTVNPSPEPTTSEEPKSDEAVSETPVPQNDETTEETKTENIENTNSDTTIPETKKESITVHIEPTGEYTPKDKTRIFDEADRFSAQNGMIEKRSPQTHHIVDDEHRVHKIAVIDTDFSYNGTGDTFGNRLFINQGMWTVGKGNKYSHGSQVAAVVAAHNKTSLIYGYSTESYGMISPNTQHFDTAHSQGVRIFNNSYGNTPREESVKEKGWEGLTKNPLYEMLAKMAAEDSIFVWSAGNEGKLTQYGQHKHATIESHIPVLNDAARRGWITVAAITGKWKSDYSNNIGSRAQNWGIATYGDWKVFGDIGVQGTSFATPVVSAVVAKVWEHFPWMTNHLVTQTILSTASQLGTDNVTTGPNEQIGWGVLNESRALKGPARFDKRLLVKGDNEFVTVNLDHRNYQDKSRLTWSNDIAGDANFRKLGTGTLYFTGRNSYLGKTLVEEGTLSLSNALTHSDVMIEKNGTLHTENSEQAVEIGQSVTNNGSLDVYGKGLSIGGNYTADKDARTVIDIHTALLDIKGTADMQNSRILADVANINEVPFQSETIRTILKAGSLVNYNNFYTVSDHIAPYILVSKIEKQGNEIQATYKRNQTANVLRSVGAVSRSAENTSTNLDKVLDEVAMNPTSSIKADSVSIINAKPMSVASTVESLSAEIYTSSQNMIVNENRLFSQNIAERAFHSLQDEKSDVYAVTNRQSYRISQNGYANAEIEGNQSYVGADKQTDHLLLGISAYHSRQKADFERSAGSAKLHQQGGAIYAGYQLDNNYLLAQLGMANAENKIKRSILMPNETRRVETDVKSRLYHFYTELGHRIKFKQGEISPFIGYQFDSVYQKAFDEGKNFGIQADRTQYNLNSYLLGLRATMKWGDLSLNTTLSHRMTPKAENAFGFNARYIGAESEIELQGISPAKYVTMAKLGLNYQITEALHLFSEYAIARQKGGEKWQNVSVGMKYQF